MDNVRGGVYFRPAPQTSVLLKQEQHFFKRFFFGEY